MQFLAKEIFNFLKALGCTEGQSVDDPIKTRHMIVPLHQGSGEKWGEEYKMEKGVLSLPNSRKFIFTSVCTDDMTAMSNIQRSLNNFFNDLPKKRIELKKSISYESPSVNPIEFNLVEIVPFDYTAQAATTPAPAAAPAASPAEAPTPASSGGKRQSIKRFLRKNKKRSHSRGGKLLRKLSHRFNKKQQTRKQKRKNSLRRRKNKLNKKTKQR